MPVQGSEGRLKSGHSFEWQGKIKNKQTKIQAPIYLKIAAGKKLTSKPVSALPSTIQCVKNNGVMFSE